MNLSRLKKIGGFFLAVVLSAPAFAASDAHSALPGTLNYVEGQANVGDQELNAKSIGQVTLQAGDSLATQKGKAEILLTPGVFLRADDNSSVRMISPSLTNTEVDLNQGRALVEVAEIHEQNNLKVRENGVETRLLKKGLYEFDADRNQLLVFDGKVAVQDGDREVKVDGGHELDLTNGDMLKANKFDKKEYKQSDLYQWSSLRSEYLAEANAETARVYVTDAGYGPGWFGPGWYWVPGFGTYTYIPGSGIWNSPFGWGYYSPIVVYRTPIFYRGGPDLRHLNNGRHVAVARPPARVYHPAPAVVSHQPALAGGFPQGGGHIGGGVHLGARR